MVQELVDGVCTAGSKVELHIPTSIIGNGQCLPFVEEVRTRMSICGETLVGLAERR